MRISQLPHTWQHRATSDGLQPTSDGLQVSSQFLVPLQLALTEKKLMYQCTLRFSEGGQSNCGGPKFQWQLYLSFSNPEPRGPCRTVLSLLGLLHILPTYFLPVLPLP